MSAVEALVPGSVEWHRFRWEGARLRRYNNTHQDRFAAALRLREHLKSLVDQHPHAQHFVIAHSHGGNVALHALRDPALAAGVQGVACLATPTGAPRDVQPYMAALTDATRKIGWLSYLVLTAVPLWAIGKACGFVPGRRRFQDFGPRQACHGLRNRQDVHGP